MYGTLLNWKTICCEKLQMTVNYKVIDTFSWRHCMLEQNVYSCSRVLACWLTQTLPAPQRDKTLFTTKTFISCHGCKLFKRRFCAMAALVPGKEPPSTHFVWGCEGPRGGSLDVLEKGESWTCCNIYSRSSNLWRSQYIDYAVQCAGFGLHKNCGSGLAFNHCSHSKVWS